MILAGCADPAEWPPAAAIEVVSVTSDRVSFRWPPADGASAYIVRVDGVHVARLGADARSYEALELSEASEHRFEVVALGPDGTSSSVLARRARTSDGTPPSFPEGAPLTVRVEPSEDSSEAVLEWPAATDNVGLARYRVFAGDEELATVEPPETTLRIPHIDDGARYRVRALDAEGNESEALEVVWQAPPPAEEPSPPPEEPARNARNDVGLAVASAQADVDRLLLGAFGPSNEVPRIGAATTASAEDLLAQAEGVGIAVSRDTEPREEGEGGVGGLLERPRAQVAQRGQVALGELRATAGPPYDAAPLERALRLRSSAMRRCYERELERGSSRAGVVEVAFTLTSSGSVANASVTRSLSSEIDSCVLVVVRGIRHAEGPDEPVTFALSVSFALSE